LVERLPYDFGQVASAAACADDGTLDLTTS
jgi:hypothetical protein